MPYIFFSLDSHSDESVTSLQVLLAREVYSAICDIRMAEVSELIAQYISVLELQLKLWLT